jgi:Flp pilus assembly protein TadD
MMDAERVLRPLLEARAHVSALDSYDSPEALAGAVQGTWEAVDRTLRTYLRADVTAPDAVRMTAMSPAQMSSDVVLAELRRHNLVSLVLAGSLHELAHAVERAGRGEVRAADADTARTVVDALVHEVTDVARRTAAETSGAVPEPAAAPVEPAGPRPVHASELPLPRRPLVLGAIAVIVVVVALVAILLTRGESSLEQGIAAFRDGRAGVAEQHFRRAIENDGDDVTARLYLARVLRGQGRLQEAADLLRASAAAAPGDAAVRRELGYLFLDLERPTVAVEQLRRAVELEPDDPLNWVALYRAMVQADDHAGAAELLGRAPADAQSRIRDATGPPDNGSR